MKVIRSYTRDNINNNDYQAGDCFESDQNRLISTEMTSSEIYFNINNLNQDAQDAFERALDTWRCAVGIDFQIISNPSAFPLAKIVNVGIGNVGLAGKVAETNLSTGTCIFDNQRLLIPTAITFINPPSIPPNDWDWYYDIALPVPPKMRDFESAALHEIGHAIGLNHTCNFDNVMFSNKLDLEKDFRVLHEDDLEGGEYCTGRSLLSVPPPVSSDFCGFSLTKYNCSTTSVKNLYNSAPFEVYPNPATDQLKIEMEISLGEYNFEIYNSHGMLISKFEMSTSTEMINIENIESGVYFLKMNNNKQSYSKKFIKL